MVNTNLSIHVCLVRFQLFIKGATNDSD